MRALIVVSFLLLAACGENSFEPYIEPSLQPYADMYKNYKKNYTNINYVRPIHLMYDDLTSNYIGLCQKFSNGDRMIFVDRTFWANASEADREILILHEYGHCDLNLGHSEPKSIMEPYHIGAWNYLANQLYYLEELFGLRSTETLATINKTIACSHMGGH